MPETIPVWVTGLSLLSTILSWGTGALIYYVISPRAAAGYLLLCACVVLLSTNLRCRFCCYYCKRCPAGVLGLISSRLFARGDPAGFCDQRNIMPVAIPSFGVLLLPLAAGIVWSAPHFSWAVAGLTAFYFVVAGIGGFYLQSYVFCKNCAQGKSEIGCPSRRMMQGGKLD